jgi:tRNA (cytidine/uridine-2'-O-)-methyltransferase
MLHIVLFEPEIPPNTGNVVRLAANAGCKLHLVEPLGFDISDKAVRRAGLDYAEFTEVVVHPDWQACRRALQGQRMFALTTKGQRNVFETKFAAGDVFVFGPESRGLPAALLAELGDENCLRLPMMPRCRSLNLSNAVAVTMYEAWRQLSFENAA